MNDTITREFEIKNVNAAGIFSGYGSVYDVTDWGDDIVAPNAFSDSLTSWNSKGKLPAMLWQHNPREVIGKYTRMNEDSKGLFVEGQLALKTQRGQEAYDLLKMNALDGMSIGFQTRDDSFDQKTGIRTIKKADLWEVSIVTFPMNEQATVAQVKALPEFFTVSDLERFLRDAGNYSRSEAKTLTSRVVAMVRRDVVAGEGSSAAIVEAIQRTTGLLRPLTSHTGAAHHGQDFGGHRSSE